MPDGKLLIVATPIGNLSDLSDRAREALAQADLVACEDTRRTGRLLAHLGLKKRLRSLHEHNERHRVAEILAEVEDGSTVALVSDAGTPLVSDPGYLLVREASQRRLQVTAIPGPSAVLTALAVSGLPPQPFTFVGFPPRKGGKRRAFYRRFASLDHTLVIFESPHRLLVSLEDARSELGDRPAVITRELTKLHEEILRGSLTTLIDEIQERTALKGEFALVVGPFERDREPAAESRQ